MNLTLSINLLAIIIFNVLFHPTYYSCPIEKTFEEPIPSGTVILNFSSCIPGSDILETCPNTNLKVICHDTQDSNNFPLVIFNQTILKTTEALDREQRETYELRCLYSPDSSEGESSTCYTFDFTLHINDTNDNGPMFTETLYTVEMFESNANNSKIISESPIITDMDAG